MLAGEGEGTRKRSVDDHALFRRTSRGPYWLADPVLARDFQHRTFVVVDYYCLY
jgi:hypothetical protein